MGATAVVQQVRAGDAGHALALAAQPGLERKPAKLAGRGAGQQERARIAWKLMVSGEHYDPARQVATTPAVAREGRGAALRGGSAPRPSLRSCTRPRLPEAVMTTEQHSEFGAKSDPSPGAEAGACSRAEQMV